MYSTVPTTGMVVPLLREFSMTTTLNVTTIELSDAIVDAPELVTDPKFSTASSNYKPSSL